MEPPTPKEVIPIKLKKKNLFSTELLYNNKKYNFNLDSVNENIIQFQIEGEYKHNLIKYQNGMNFEEFKNLNKYFRQFDSINEIGDDLVCTIKENNIKIINENNNEIAINIKLLSRNDNIIEIYLQKIELNEKEKINILFTKYEELEKKFEINNKNFENILKEKENRINQLEKEVNDLKDELKIIKSHLLPSNNLESIVKNSNIFQSVEEITFILDNIPNNKNNIQMLFNSEIYGKNNENKEKLIEAYIGKNDLIVLVKTKKNFRFGGYAHECFEIQNFQKRDVKAFLFNLNKKKIYQSKGNGMSIWRADNTKFSINFGSGVDFKVFHNYLTGKNRTNDSGFDYDYKKEKNPLNDEEYYEISFLEIYKVILS